MKQEKIKNPQAVPDQMPIFRVNSVDGIFTMPDKSSSTLRNALRKVLSQTPVNAPVVIMLHGFKFSPLQPHNDPHPSLFSRGDDHPHWKICSWPAQLDLAQPNAATGLAIAYGWNARSTQLSPAKRLAEVYARAAQEGRQLARLLNLIGQIDPLRRVDILCHSMGARVALQSLRWLEKPILDRVIMMGAAEFSVAAFACLSQPAARRVSFYNITSRQNALYDRLFELAAPASGRKDSAIGMAFPFQRKNWINIAIDASKTEEKLSALGITLGTARRGFCHWSFYTRPGVFAFYNAILRRKAGFDIASLRPALHYDTDVLRPKRPLLAGLAWSRLYSGATSLRPKLAFGKTANLPMQAVKGH